MDGRMRRELAMSILSVISIPAVLAAQSGTSCAPDNLGIKLPPGFCATLFADSIAGPRQITVGANGDVFVAAQGGRGGAGGIIALRDPSGTGRATIREQFAAGASAHLALFEGHVYAELQPPRQARGQTPSGPPGTTTILRYPLKAGELKPSGPPDTIVQGIVFQPGHYTRNFAIGRDGALYVNIGSATNNCQARDRAKGEPGVNPCVELETRAGIWKFDARKKNQTPSSASHFAKGIRNAVGIAIAPTDGRLWVTQHGRDDLASWFAQLGMDSVAALKYNAENPAEELMQVNQGDDFGWPYCYFSAAERKRVQAPEYGGDGKKVADCGTKKDPVATFPGHWAPNALFFYTGSALPAKYKNGAFIAFHGSWNRAPEPQGGFNVVFQPLRDNKAVGSYEVFADNFAPNIGAGRGNAGARRPTAIAQTADGGLLIADDASGKIYKIAYTGK
jgi:glucose/arabinose dehydrogenase